MAFAYTSIFNPRRMPVLAIGGLGVQGDDRSGSGVEDVRRPRGGATSSPPWGRGEAPAREAEAEETPGLSASVEAE